MAVVTELVTKFVFSGSTTPLTQYNKLLEKGIQKLTAFTSSIDIDKLTQYNNLLKKIATNLRSIADAKAATPNIKSIFNTNNSVNTSNISNINNSVNTDARAYTKLTDARKVALSVSERYNLSVRNSTNNVTRANIGLGAQVLAFNAVSRSIGFAINKIYEWHKASIASINPMIQLGKYGGVSAKYIQEMGYAASATGSNIEDIEQALSNLTMKLANAAISGDADFSRLGISIRDVNGNMKTADVILGEISDKIKHFPRAQQLAFASMFAIPPRLLETLNKSKQEISDLRNSVKGLVTEKDLSNIDRFNKSLSKLWFHAGNVTKKLYATTIGSAFNIADNGLPNLPLVPAAPMIGPLGGMPGTMNQTNNITIHTTETANSLGKAVDQFTDAQAQAGKVGR